jgi:D-alanyl-D-alanine carboxypeptidase/D-alanyl-D-alanine-endopeptidase (penicillin-binding protein 4)
VVEYRGRPLPDILFPILNTSQNWFAEMLLKVLGREIKGEGAWSAGLDVERRFLIDSVKIDSTAFALEDGSGLAAGNLVTPHAFAQLLAYMHRHPKGAAFVAALPHAGQPGSLLKRFVGSPLEGRVIAKTGSIDRVNSLSGYIEQPNGRTVTFSVQANGHAVPYSQMLAQIDSAVVEIGKTR